MSRVENLSSEVSSWVLPHSEEWGDFSGNFGEVLKQRPWLPYLFEAVAVTFGEEMRAEGALGVNQRIITDYLLESQMTPLQKRDVVAEVREQIEDGTVYMVVRGWYYDREAFLSLIAGLGEVIVQELPHRLKITVEYRQKQMEGYGEAVPTDLIHDWFQHLKSDKDTVRVSRLIFSSMMEMPEASSRKVKNNMHLVLQDMRDYDLLHKGEDYIRGDSDNQPTYLTESGFFILMVMLWEAGVVRLREVPKK